MRTNAGQCGASEGGRGYPEEWVLLGGGCEAAKAATS